MKVESNEFEPRWVITAKFHPNRSTGSGCTGETPDRTTDKQTNKQTDRQTDTSADNKGHLAQQSTRTNRWTDLTEN